MATRSRKTRLVKFSRAVQDVNRAVRKTIKGTSKRAKAQRRTLDRAHRRLGKVLAATTDGRAIVRIVTVKRKKKALRFTWEFRTIDNLMATGGVHYSRARQAFRAWERFRDRVLGKRYITDRETWRESA